MRVDFLKRKERWEMCVMEGAESAWIKREDRTRRKEVIEVAPPGQDSCQPGPDMTSAEGEAGRHSQWVGGVRGWHQGAVWEGSRHQSCPCSALAHFLEGDLLGSTAVSEHHYGYLTLPTRDSFCNDHLPQGMEIWQRSFQNKYAEFFRLS